MADRYCGSVKHELRPDDMLRSSCVKAFHEAAQANLVASALHLEDRGWIDSRFLLGEVETKPRSEDVSCGHEPSDLMEPVAGALQLAHSYPPGLISSWERQ